MEWIDIAGIVFACVTMNHLGLIGAIEGLVRIKLPILNCPKCSTFWAVMAYGMAAANSSLFTLHYSLTLLAISFLASYTSIWLELLEGYIDTLYLKLYEQIYPTADTADAGALSAAGTVSVLPGEGSRDGSENAVS